MCVCVCVCVCVLVLCDESVCVWKKVFDVGVLVLGVLYVLVRVRVCFDNCLFGMDVLCILPARAVGSDSA